MKHLSIITALFALLVSSCGKKIFEIPEDAIILTEENMPAIQYLEAERIDLPDSMFLKSDFSVFHDTILVAINDDYPDPTYLTVMNLNTKKVIGHYYPKGDGPNEVVAIYGNPDNNCMKITDYPTLRQSIFYIDSVLIKGDEYKPNLFQTDLSWFTYTLITDSSFLVSNMFYCEECGEYENKGTTPEFYFSDLNGNHEEITKIYPFGCDCSGHITSNKKQKKVFMAYNRFPKYKILDYDLNVIKKMYGPDNYYDVELGCDEGRSLFIMNNKYHSYNSAIASNDKYVFVRNDRVIDQPHTTNMAEWGDIVRETSIENNELYQFDWDGNMVGRYKVKDNLVCTITISEDSKTLFFTGYNEDRDYCLYKVQLP
ncbi:MAG: TolB-like 6-bladed beta-propeller domain-containing protein [Bacteroidales bacterium]|nr:TolB-like 6-bladed beta-propeller domain-containing protein [Bacteroidales bacterium]